jgi:hypothetical protein
MSRRNRGRGITVAALVATLALAAPVYAAGPGGWHPASGLVLRAWQWLVGVWPGAEADHPVTKAGMGVDPNGLPAPAAGPTSGSTTPPAGTEADPAGRS